jgi:hypothetical protein
VVLVLLVVQEVDSLEQTLLVVFQLSHSESMVKVAENSRSKFRNLDSSRIMRSDPGKQRVYCKRSMTQSTNREGYSKRDNDGISFSSWDCFELHHSNDVWDDFAIATQPNYRHFRSTIHRLSNPSFN